MNFQYGTALGIFRELHLPSPTCTFILRASKQTQEILITLQFIVTQVTGNVTQFIASFHK